MKFCDMPYERIDVKAATEALDAAAERLSAAKTIEEAEKAFAEREKIISHVQTMSTIAYIRHTVNTFDEFYEKENDFNDENAPLIEQSEQKFTEAMLGSPLRAQLEEKYGKLMFVNAELSRRCFSPEIIPDLQEENKLSSEYQKLIASAQIDFNGEKLSLSQLGAYKENAKRDVRRAAYEAESGFYMAHADELDRIFDSLVKCRTRIAKKLGFNTFTELAYCRQTRNCYDAKDVSAFRSRFVHLESALVFLPYGTMVDEFQHIVYDSPELTPAERNKKWLALERKYRPYMDFGDVDFYSNGRGWQRQLHIYLYPFYYIDYCLAQTAALEFWSLSQKDYKDAWQRYLRFVSFGGKKSFKELCAAAGIDDPFGEHALNGVARTANAWLDSNG